MLATKSAVSRCVLVHVAARNAWIVLHTVRSSMCGVKAVHTRDILCSLAKWSPEMPSSGRVARERRRGSEGTSVKNERTTFAG